jgi:hypothetical protein
VAVPENRGGFRPTAPQNNPANINPMGGNGQSGMNTDYTGFAYGQNKAVNEQRKAAPITAPAPTSATAETRRLIQQPLIPLNAPTQYPDMPDTAGANAGDGPDESILNLPQGIGTGQNVDSGIQAVRAMYLRDPRNQDLRRILEIVDQQIGPV